MLTPYWGYIGMGASAAFAFICSHFAKHYVWEVARVSAVAFRVHGHTFFGNKGSPRLVQVGTTAVQESDRYVAFKVRWMTLFEEAIPVA
jgi:hypothetical protein